MASSYYSLGQAMSRDDISIEQLKDIVIAAENHPGFEIQGFYSNSNQENEIQTEALLLDCMNDSVSASPKVDIRYTEPIAIECRTSNQSVPEVKALRKEFPRTTHIFDSSPGTPIRLCLYEQPWSEIRLGWSPMQFLNRILWWMKETANDNLHQPNQVPEMAFFGTGWTIIVPSSLVKRKDETWQIIPCHIPQTIEGPGPFFRLKSIKKDLLIQRGMLTKNGQGGYFPLIIKAEPTPQKPMVAPPETLGELHDHLEKYDVNLWESIIFTIQSLFSEDAKTDASLERLVLFINLPKKLNDSKDSIALDSFFGFSMAKTIGNIGTENDLLAKKTLTEPNSKGLRAVPVCNFSKKFEAWRGEPIKMVKIIPEMTIESYRHLNRITGLPSEKPLLIGCGALGGTLLTQWVRMGWNNWTVVDNDVLLSHNLARHVLFDDCVGFAKVHEIGRLCNSILPKNYRGVSRSICLDALDTEKTELVNAYKECDFIVDVSTTLSVPRSLSERDLGRCSTLFVTPSGNDGVLILEDKGRSLRLAHLEAQYYRWIINHPAGNDYLKGHHGDIRYGGGCRDISNRIPQSSITVHTGILCQQIIQLGVKQESALKIWQLNPDDGSVHVYKISVGAVHASKHLKWRIIWDEQTVEKIKSLRLHNLPNETGGIILGFVDRFHMTIYVVDLLAAPDDSECTPSSFQRGIVGVREKVDDVKRRTAGIVGYIGEWHSHPANSSVQPSALDLTQLDWTREEMALVGQPGIILIAGDNDYAFFVQEEDQRVLS